MKLEWQAPVIRVISLEDINSNSNLTPDTTGQGS